jgi:hypothetical protein
MEQQIYNTDKTPIIVREFGRNMQKMILYANKLENREDRQEAIERIVELILDMYPTTNRNIDDYRIKIWSHVMQICDYELDIDIPDFVPKEPKRIKPDLIPYPSNHIKFRHYGRGIQNLINKAVEIEDEEQQTAFIQVIASFMKMSYKTWNRGNASDDVIRKEMIKMSKGQLKLSEDVNIDYLIQPSQKRSGGNKKTNSKRKNYRKRK